jgi:hypothetical protein
MRILFLLFGLFACTDSPIDTDTDSEADTEVVPPWGDGPHTVSGNVYFFDLEGTDSVVWQDDVVGGEVYVVEAPELRVTVDPANDHAFSISGIPVGVEVTLAAVHDDYHPHMTQTFHVTEDIVDITFQSVTHTIASLAALMVGADIDDDDLCQMAITVTAPDPDGVYAPGEPGATVSLDPAVPVESGPFYFNTSVRPDQSLSETTTDGGVLVAGAQPGVYTWNGHKDGVEFNQLKMRCDAGWLTNASPPYGMNVVSP